MLPPEELARLWEQYADRVLLIVRGFGEPAEDAVQEAFVRLSAEPEPPQETLAWLVQVARNQLLQWWRADRRRRRRAAERCRDEELLTAGGIEDKLDAQAVSRALQELPAEQRQPVVMHIWGGLSFEQIAQMLGTSRSTAHRHYTAGMAELRKHFVDSQTPGRSIP